MSMTSSTDFKRRGECMSNTRAMTRDISANLSRLDKLFPHKPRQPRSSRTGAPRRQSWPCTRERDKETFSRPARKLELLAVESKLLGPPEGTLFGNPRATGYRDFHVGGTHLGNYAPVYVLTMECTMLCGCMTTFILSRVKPNNQPASITSNPLFMRVAEL